ncbi:MAG: S8 family peptidase [Planctomycetota bacterium]
MNKTLLYKGVTIVIVTVSTFLFVQIVNAIILPEGHDFTNIPADTDYAPGELLVRFAPKAIGIQLNTEEKNDILTSLGGGTVEQNYTIVPGLSLVKLPTGLAVKDALKIYNNVGGILYAGPNYRTYIASTLIPNDPCFSKLWGMHNTGQTGGTEDADIDAPEAWYFAVNSDIIVAVIDSGTDYDHPDLAANIWINEAEYNGDPDVDDDGNGYKDDVYGYDFCYEDGDPIDDMCHGTHVAGTIGAVGNNNKGVVGVCWQVEIMSLKSFDNHGVGYISDIIPAIYYAVNMGAKVINASWGRYTDNPSQSLKDAIDEAGYNGVLFVAAAGNAHYDIDDPEEESYYPAAYDSDNIIAVMSTDQNDAKSEFSNWGPISVDLSAPGGRRYEHYAVRHYGVYDIFSTMPTFMTDYMEDENLYTYYDYLAGTSMAAPHVSGACALLWAERPSLGHLEVKHVLMDKVDKIAALDDLCVSEGRLNLYKALNPPIFSVKDSSDHSAAWFDNIGDFYLRGTLYECSYPEASDHDEFRFQDMYGTERMIIDADTGDVYLSGLLYEEEWSLIPPTYMGNLIFKTKYGTILAYVDYGGHLHLKGKVYEDQ